MTRLEYFLTFVFVPIPVFLFCGWAVNWDASLLRLLVLTSYGACYMLVSAMMLCCGFKEKKGK